MRLKSPILLVLSALLFGASTACVWIDEAEIAAFNDRDGDGLDHGVDCDDTNKSIQGTVKFYPDVDGDHFGDMHAQPKEACPSDGPPGHVPDNTDCSDNDASSFPGGTEVCDLQDRDEDCDGAADNADQDAEGKTTWYPDADGDLFGDQDAPGVLACDPPSGAEVLNNADCDDSQTLVNPDGVEVCDPDDTDEDCSGQADDQDPGVSAATFTAFYADADGDGYGDSAAVAVGRCDPLAGEADNADDCDDSVAAIHPGAAEVCDAADTDEDCSGDADDADASADVATMTLWFPDADADGYGDELASPRLGCDPVGGEIADNTDCDDSRADVSPEDPEICDLGNADEDCDGLVNDVDPDAVLVDWWADADGDGFGVNGPPATQACSGPALHAPRSGDCDDGAAGIHPDAHEYHDGIDSDCDPGATDFICGQAYLRVPTDYASIQAAVNAVDQVNYCDGDTIEVLPGIYDENVAIADKSPNLVGLVGPASTTIRGTGAGRVVSIDRSSTRLSGFTVTGGVSAADGGGIRVFYGVGTVLDNLVVHGNSAVNGGGIELRNPVDVTLQDSTVRNNTATTGDGGGIRVSATGSAAGGLLWLHGLDVHSNGAGDAGGGIGVDLDHLSVSASVVIEDSQIHDNTAFNGGGVWAQEIPWFELRNSDIDDNFGSANYGGVQIVDAPALVEGVRLEGNMGVTVGALQAQSYLHGAVTLRDVVARDNALTQANGHSVLLRGDSSFGSTVERVEVARTVRGMNPIWGSGLAIEGKVVATNLLVVDETGPSGLFLAESGSGVAASHQVSNVTVVGCEHDGIGVGNAIATSISLTNVISAFNAGYGVNQTLINAVVSASDTFGNGLGPYNGQNHVGVNGNIAVDPLFTSYSGGAASTGWDLHLGPGSPCIDAGSATVLDADGGPSDMGHYGGPGAP